MIETIVTPVTIALIAILFAETSGIMDKVKWWMRVRITDRTSEIRSGKKQLYQFWVTVKMADAVEMNLPFRVKPLDCSLCLSFWMSIAWCIIDGKSFELFIFTIGTSTYLSVLLTKFIMK